MTTTATASADAVKEAAPAVSGVLVVDKPAGPTSHDVVDGVRRALRTRRVGHTGTLDPFATGVLPICIGKATRLASFLTASEKVYRASVRFGFDTSTDDVTGQALSEPRGFPPEHALRQACAALVGEIWQLPPVYSAKRVAGRRMYELAREGIVPPREASRVTVHSIDVLRFAGDVVELEVRCSSGTYIRAIARDLGEVLGTGAHLTELRRTRSGGFGLEDSVPFPSLDGASERLIPMERTLTDMPAVHVGADGALAVRQGRYLGTRLVVSGFPEEPPPRMRVIDQDGALLALAVPRGFGPQPAPGLPVERVLHADVVVAD